MDVLSVVLREMRFENAGYRRLELRAPWAVSFDQSGLRGIHIVLRGRCELVLADGAVHPLETGDLVVAPRADPHVLRSAGQPRVRPVSSFELARSGGPDIIRGGGDGDRVVLVCGAFVFHQADHPALDALPRLIHVPGGTGRTPRWLRTYSDVLMAEAADSGPGSEVVLARLSNALVARALRFHVRDASERGWLAGLRDRHIARALAARFRTTVGDTPMRYLLACRMAHAKRLLNQGDATLAGIAGAVGYASEAALSTAFKRYTGVSPMAYRCGERHETEARRFD